LPIYEYECSKCGHITEITLGINDPKPQTLPCQKCASCARHIISQSSFVLKGGGWDSDGYEKKRAKAEKEHPNPVPT
jgi:putative FmdB family regulatory protein